MGIIWWLNLELNTRLLTCSFQTARFQFEAINMSTFIYVLKFTCIIKSVFLLVRSSPLIHCLLAKRPSFPHPFSTNYSPDGNGSQSLEILKNPIENGLQSDLHNPNPFALRRCMILLLSTSTTTSFLFSRESETRVAFELQNGA